MVFRIKNGSRGFTLLELLIVLAVIGILASIAIPNYRESIKRAKEATLKEDLFQMRKLIQQFKLDKGRYPYSLQELVDEKYLRAIPVDPMTGSNATWVEVEEELTLEEIAAGKQPGIIDVKSGSEKIGLNGKPYSEW
ncbi:MAG: prepilin-type N-terminal cleavage/methylation domain-containing protein [Candidatus Aminicenantes bacterium]|nr:prepilin-type N-terminal cleavage/methylation domain-containing protein [Candidatus Aminicenantes bacterium]